MRSVRVALLVIAVLQVISTVVGSVQLLVVPEWYAPMLDGTLFEGRYVASAILLGVVIGGAQWCAVYVHLRHRHRLALGHAVAGLVMVGWIAGECLVLDSFIWPHALWGGLGVAQLVLPLILLGVLRPQPDQART